MPKKVVITRSVDGSKKVIIGTRKDNAEVDKTKTIQVKAPDDKRAKPIVTKAGLTKEKTPYKYGGKVKYK